jgi:endonuclease YncB( thermonuclease family)
MDAWRTLQDLVSGHHVRCVLAQAKESRGRPVMRCYTGDLELNAEMVRLGFAVDCYRYSRGRYQAIEQEARAARRGAWAGTFVTPAVFKGQNYCDPR